MYYLKDADAKSVEKITDKQNMNDDLGLHDKSQDSNGTKWSKDTDMTRFTDEAHPDFWSPDKRE